MSNLADQSGQAVAALQLEKFLSSKNAERWCKIMSPGYPAAAYWLCQEARILQEFNHTHPFVARFIGVDTERRILVTEAPGYTLSQWLTTPQPTASTTPEVVQPLKQYLTIRGKFEDRIIKNKDVRAFRTDEGTILFLYSFIDNTHLVVTDKESTLAEILTRLEKQSFIR
jgi:hypothetical protein